MRTSSMIAALLFVGVASRATAAAASDMPSVMSSRVLTRVVFATSVESCAMTSGMPAVTPLADAEPRSVHFSEELVSRPSRPIRRMTAEP
jgi:hypothetical protein